jgi:lipopolysaccharide export system permease protein
MDDINYSTSELSGVVIYDQKDQRMSRTITADSGRVEFSSEGEYILFHLRDGQIHEQDLTDEADYRISDFSEQTFVVHDLGTKLEESERSYRGDREMSAAQMAQKTDAWRKEIGNYHEVIVEDTDSAVGQVLDPPKEKPRLKSNEPDVVYRYAVGQAYRETSQMARILQTRIGQIHSNRQLVNKYSVEIHKKFSLPTACLAFVLIGAPLGVMGRKAGMAISVGMSIALFTIYWAFLIGGEQLADRLLIPPWLAMWAANLLLIAIGLILLFKVRQERPLGWVLRRLFWWRG